MKTLLVGLLLLAVTSASYAQSVDRSGLEWYNAGFGISTSRKGPNFHAGVDYNRQIQAHAVQFGYWFSGGLIGGLDNEGYSVHSVVLGYGRHTSNRAGVAAAFVGPSILAGQRPSGRFEDYGDPIPERYLSAGIAGNAQLFLKPIPELGIGIEIIGALNPVKSSVGFRLSMHASTWQ